MPCGCDDPGDGVAKLTVSCTWSSERYVDDELDESSSGSASDSWFIDTTTVMDGWVSDALPSPGIIDTEAGCRVNVFNVTATDAGSYDVDMLVRVGGYTGTYPFGSDDVPSALFELTISFDQPNIDNGSQIEGWMVPSGAFDAAAVKASTLETVEIPSRCVVAETTVNISGDEEDTGGAVDIREVITASCTITLEYIDESECP